MDPQCLICVASDFFYLMVKKCKILFHDIYIKQSTFDIKMAKI